MPLFSMTSCVKEDKQTVELEAPILHLGSSNRTPLYMVTTRADGVGLQMEVDTRSSVSLVSQSIFRKVWPKRKLRVQVSSPFLHRGAH